MRLNQFHRAARARVRVGAATSHEQRGRARVPPLEGGLRNACVVAVVLHEARLQRGVVTRVPKDDRERRAAAAVDPQHWNGTIDRPIGRERDAPVCGKRRLAPRITDLRRLQLGERVERDDGQERLQARRVRAHGRPLFGRQVVRHRQLIIHDRP